MKKELGEEANKGAIEACVEWLMDNEFISIQKEGEGSLICIFICASMKYLKSLYSIFIAFYYKVYQVR